MRRSRHAEIRAQQRGIPPMVDRLLDEFGEEAYDHKGAVKVYLSKKSIRKMEKSLGKQVVKALSRFLKFYRLESCRDGRTITMGHLTKPIRNN